MTITVQPDSGILMFDMFDGDNQIQTLTSDLLDGITSPIQFYIAVIAVDECVNTDDTFAVTVMSCGAGNPGTNRNRVLSFNPNIMDRLELLYGDILDADADQVLPQFGDDWPEDDQLVAVGMQRPDHPESWISVSSPAEGFQLAVMFGHVPPGI